MSSNVALESPSKCLHLAEEVLLRRALAEVPRHVRVVQHLRERHDVGAGVRGVHGGGRRDRGAVGVGDGVPLRHPAFGVALLEHVAGLHELAGELLPRRALGVDRARLRVAGHRAARERAPLAGLRRLRRLRHAGEVEEVADERVAGPALRVLGDAVRRAGRRVRVDLVHEAHLGEALDVRPAAHRVADEGVALHAHRPEAEVLRRVEALGLPVAPVPEEVQLGLVAVVVAAEYLVRERVGRHHRVAARREVARADGLPVLAAHRALDLRHGKPGAHGLHPHGAVVRRRAREAEQRAAEQDAARLVRARLAVVGVQPHAAVLDLHRGAVELDLAVDAREQVLDAEVVGLHHMGGIGQADGEGPSGLDVLHGLVGLGEVQRDGVALLHGAPGGVHDIDGAVFVVGRDHQDRHGEDAFCNIQLCSHVNPLFLDPPD